MCHSGQHTELIDKAFLRFGIIIIYRNINMPEWLIGLISVIAGIGASLLVTYLAHLWKMSERYQELLAEKRLLACDKLIGSLIDLCEELSPIEKGIQPLLDPTPNQHISELARFAATSEGILGRTIMKTWYKYYKALLFIQSEAVTSASENPHLYLALNKLMNEWIDKIGDSIKDELKGINIEFITTSERTQLTKEGRLVADNLIKEVE